MVLLKRLTLKNFKSFRNAVIPFAPGFTVIMGPNGSGKSNIIDALVFVLGEGRLKLVRASRLRDLVNVRAKDGEALVSLDIEADGKTYTITRSINKKGSSVYRLNGKRTTRHEIISLLSSLGISQRGYNFVLQGEITRLIKMTPLERRALIDEIAGISEYEEKKEEALKKLDAVSERIKEVSIVLGEREERLRVLEKEREDALRYLELKDLVSSLRKGILLKEIEKTKKRLEEIEEALSERERRTEELRKRQASLEEELRELEEKGKTLTEEISKAYGESGEGEYNALLRELERIENEVKHVRLRREEIRAEITKLEEEMEKLRKEREVLLQEITSVKEKKSAKDAEVNELRKRINAVEEAVRSEQEEAAALQRKLDEVESQISALKEEYASLREEYGKVVGEYNAKLEEQRKLQEKMEKRKREAEKLREELKSIEKELEVLERERSSLLEREKRLNQEYLLLQEEVKELREEVGALRGAAMALRSIGASLEVVDALLEAQRKGELRGIKGMVASLISYDKKYRRALEAAAGRRLFYIVVETANDAAEAIKYLKRHNLGRATFIPLDRVRPHVVEVPSGKGIVGRALDLVSYDRTVKRAMEYVFGDTVVTENIDVAKELRNVRAVTLDGDVVERSGVMSGGSSRGESVLRIFEAEKKRSELKRKELELKELISALSSLRRELNEVGRKLEKKRAEAERIRAKLEELAEEGPSGDLTEVERRMEEIRERMTQIANQISDLEMKRANLLREVKRTGSTLLEELSRLRREYDAKVLELNEYVSLLREKNALLSSLEERIAAVEGRTSSLKEEMESLSSSESSLLNRREEISERIREMEEEMKRLKEALNNLLQEKAALDDDIKEVSREIGRVNSELNEIEKEVAVLSNERGMLKARLLDLEREFNEIEGEPLRELPPDPERKLRDYLEEMRSLEPVNLKAIEEYEEMKKKVEEVKERVEKLEEERKAILNLISEIEKKKREVFLETFNAIARKFEEVYRDLVGGKARLRLTDERDIFSAGLLIEATPPGKSLANIDALSGGEKALVALAFIFATALYKPAPFYVLDEPDLMLDKVNAERMAKYIKRLSRNAQFIVVSHRDVVVKEADQLIGVYLGKDGSSVVEVRIPGASQASPRAS